MYRGGGGVNKKKNFNLKDEKRKFQSALLEPPGRYTGNNFLFKGGLTRSAVDHRVYSSVPST